MVEGEEKLQRKSEKVQGIRESQTAKKKKKLDSSESGGEQPPECLGELCKWLHGRGIYRKGKYSISSRG